MQLVFVFLSVFFLSTVPKVALFFTTFKTEKSSMNLFVFIWLSQNYILYTIWIFVAASSINYNVYWLINTRFN